VETIELTGEVFLCGKNNRKKLAKTSKIAGIESQGKKRPFSFYVPCR